MSGRHDHLEQEADRIADRALGRGASSHFAVSETPVHLQRSTAPATAATETAIGGAGSLLPGAGRPLAPALRQDMEQRFGYDFSRVRVHADSAAKHSARQLHADAYTVGHSIVFGADQFAPQTETGRRLMAHELAHVMQQTGSSRTAVDRGSGSDGLSPTRAPAMIQRQETETQPTAPASEAAWTVLKPPPIVQQQSYTCWAAALQSWLGARGTAATTVLDLITRYSGTSCIEPDNSLPYPTAAEVYREWGVEFKKFASAEKLTGEVVRSLLRIKGHLLIAQVGSSLGHVLVVYGSGFDPEGKPNPNYISVMDPLSGTYSNWPLAALSYPVEVGRVGKQKRPARCLSKPGKDPEQ